MVRQEIPLDLKSGENQINVSDIDDASGAGLRHPARSHRQTFARRCLEQNYRADPITEPMLLSLYEGKTIDFEVDTPRARRCRQRQNNPQRIHAAQHFRHEPLRPELLPGSVTAASEQPVVEVNGQLSFSFPARPLPSLTDDSILKPRLEWLLSTDKAGKFPAEFSYVTGGMSWQADYNLVAPEKGDLVDIVGWVTMDNQTGKTFENARIKLMAGDVNKIQPGRIAWP